MFNVCDLVLDELLDDMNICFQVIIFLIVGYEIMSGLLIFVFYMLLCYLVVLVQVYVEVDCVLLGDIVLQYVYFVQFDVIECVLKEMLCLWLIVLSFGVVFYEDMCIGGCYVICKDQCVVIVLLVLYCDLVVWDCLEVFDIDCFLFENEVKLYLYVYKFFGNGECVCIGCQFVLIEVKFVLVVILQCFVLFDFYDYGFYIKEMLMFKLDGFCLCVWLCNVWEWLLIVMFLGIEVVM